MVSIIRRFKFYFFKKIRKFFKKNKSYIDNNKIKDIESFLISLDISHKTSSHIIKNLKKKFFLNKKININYLYEEIKKILIDILDRHYSSLDFDYSSNCNYDLYINNFYKQKKPFVFFVIGVNGVGKTTSISKIAFFLKKYNFKIMLVAADTFRSAAIEQLEYWAKKINVKLFKKNTGTDPASVVFDAINLAKSEKIDMVLIDTAGRLHNNINLLNQLLKIKKVIKKILPDSPNETSLVLDSSFGYNSLEQFKIFNNSINVDSLILTKLDGMHRGGMIIDIINNFNVPVKFVSYGLDLEKFNFFNKKKFINSFFS